MHFPKDKILQRDCSLYNLNKGYPPFSYFRSQNFKTILKFLFISSHFLLHFLWDSTQFTERNKRLSKVF